MRASEGHAGPLTRGKTARLRSVFATGYRGYGILRFVHSAPGLNRQHSPHGYRASRLAKVGKNCGFLFRGRKANIPTFFRRIQPADTLDTHPGRNPGRIF